MNYFYFVGLDVAKSTFDATILDAEEQSVGYQQFKNTPKGVERMLSWAKALGADLRTTLICAENMGVYVSQLCVSSVDCKFKLALASPLAIKRSMGIARGKNDKIDSYRIALYALLHHKRLMLYTPISESIIQLRSWFTVRENLVKNKVSTTLILHSIQENNLNTTKEQEQLLKGRISQINSDISMVEERMLAVIKSDENVRRNYNLITSVKGVGLVTAIVLLCTTGNFTLFSDSRQYACYCGIAPFEYSSGVSIRGKTKISPLSAKGIKTFLSRSAITARQYDPQLRRYYLRKIEEGKDKNSVKNVIRNKIVSRCFAVVRRGTPYVSLDI